MISGPGGSRARGVTPFADIPIKADLGQAGKPVAVGLFTYLIAAG